MANFNSSEYYLHFGASSYTGPNASDFTLDASTVYNNSNPATYIQSGPASFPDIWLLFDIGVGGTCSGFSLSITSQLQLLGHPNVYFQFSDNGTAWGNGSSTSYTATGSGTPWVGTITVRCASFTHRYLRIQMQASSATSPSTDYQKLFSVVVYDGSGTIYSPPASPPPPVQATLYHTAVGQGTHTPPSNPLVGLFLDGPRLRDFGPGDFSTGYSQGPTAPGDTCVVYGLIDLLTTDTVSYAQITYKNGNSQLIDLFYSTDGSTWTTVFTGHNASPPTTNSQTVTLNVTARYLMVRLYGPYAVTLTDFRAAGVALGTLYPVLVSFTESLGIADIQGSGPYSVKPASDSLTITDTPSKVIGRPTIAQGSSLAIASLGTSTHAALSGTWEVDWGAIDAGDSFTTGGWLLAWDGTSITVSVPLNATPSIGTGSFYTAYYAATPGSAPVYVQFDVTSLAVSVKAFTDSITLADSMAGTGQICQFTESIGFSEALSTTATIPFSDGFSLADAPVGPANPLGYTDSMTITDTPSVGYNQGFAERVLMTESIMIDDGTNQTTFAFFQDSAALADTPVVTATVPFTDGVAFTDTLATSATVPFADSLTITDIPTVPVQFSPGNVQVFLD